MPALVVALVSPSGTLRGPLAAALAAAGYAPVEAPTVAELAPRLDGRSPVAAVLDLVSPAASPGALVRAARDALGEELLLVGLTTFYSPEADRGAWTADVATFLPRPPDPAELLATLRDFLDPGADTPRQRRVLLADDDAVGLRLSAQLLAQQGYDVVTARDGNEALSLAQETRPDAIVSDILMPGLDGYRLCMAIRQSPALATTPVILLTANFVEAADRRLAEAAGATAFVVKTHSLVEVFAELDRALAAPPALVPVPEPEAVEEGWNARAHRQLLLLAAQSLESARRSALREAELSVLMRIAHTFGQRLTLRASLSEVLGLVAERGDLTFALLYLPDAAGALQPQAMTASFAAGDRALPAPERMDRLLRRAIDGEEPLPIPDGDTLDDDGRAALAALGVSSLLLTPLRLQGRTLGVLAFAAEQHDLAASPWRAYAITVGLHLAHAISLYRLAAAAPASDRAAARERLADDLASLAGLLGALLPADSPLRGALPALLARPGPLDLRDPLRAAFPTLQLASPLPVDGAGPALAAALTLLRDATVGTGELRGVTALDADGSWAVSVTAAGGEAGDADAMRVAGEILRRHGGDISPRPAPAGQRALLLRLPRAD